MTFGDSRGSRKPARLVNGGKFSKRPSNRPSTVSASTLRNSEATSQNEKAEAVALAHGIDERMGFARYESGKPKLGWLCNMHSTSVYESGNNSGRERVPGGRAGVDFYFIEEDGGTFKATLEYDPYFLIAVRRGKEAEVEEWIRRTFEGLVKSLTRVDKEDLKMPNHLLGYRRTLLELRFVNVTDLLSVRKIIMPIAEKNRGKVSALDAYAEVASANAGFDAFEDEVEVERQRTSGGVLDASDFITDVREYDVPYHVRVAIDNDIRVGKWYSVDAKHGHISVRCVEEKVQRPDPVVMAFDIETTKLPLKFPDSATDQIMMISYMIDGQGFLITNREIVSEDIADFEYTPKAEYQGPFMIFNEANERDVIERFFEHIKEAKPTVIATYNGDFFDWPFVEARASILGIDMYQEIGFRKNSEDIYQADYCAHMDAFAWVNRDSYLPQGSRGLKAVTVAKLGYDPDELDPELMTPYASERPQVLAEYSVSDAVATYYLYMKYVHPFIFSLCTIVPLGPDDTLRKGTGTLCEMLLMVQAYQHEIVLPNKHKPPKEEFWEGHLLESETYVGGHVESIEAGVFRSDIPCNFAIDATAIDELLEELDATLKFFITAEEKKDLEDVEDFEEVKNQIAAKLLSLKETPNRNERPLIYHLDVASMYPNIMTTNRLQPDSMIQESDCAACDFNRPGKTCDRRLPWAWRGEYLPAKKDEYKMIRHALENERFPGKNSNSLARTFQDLSLDEQATHVKKRLQDYCKKIYHKIHDARTIEREAIICQRENPFYVNTVRDFRDRRYDFKGKQKVWKGKTGDLQKAGADASEIDEAKKMIILYDSLQLAHKVILNSFYGYVMRKGSRWFSMEMAGVTCLTGARIIQMARQLVERIGRPLELDTDGIWCILPATFPENFAFKMKNGKKLTVSYPCAMLNRRVHEKFTNHQYQTLKDPQTYRYETYSDNTIFFEVDGPYKAMILPTSKEEDKNLKKRYAVFNHDGSLAELKGFEVKRRGELKLIKIFQTQIFKFFLNGSTLAETYASVAGIADRWLDVLYERGVGLANDELIDLICENKSMTKTLEEYGGQKSTAITTARRLAEFLGEQMVKDKGLNCKFIISSRPKNAPVTERAIPVAIFSASEDTKRFFLRKWMKDEPGDMDPRTVLDWDYYLERLGSVVQKLITIPAALQKIRNPVPRVAHPDWLEKRIRVKDDRYQQKKLSDMFDKTPLGEVDVNTLEGRSNDLEDFGSSSRMPFQQKNSVISKSVQKRKSPDPPAPADPFASLSGKMPDISSNYPAWLLYQKRKWKLQKQQRVRRRQLFGEKRDANDAIGNMFRNQAELLYTSTWQVLQLRPTDTPGEMKAYVLIDKNIHVIKVIVPRRVFLNLKNDQLPEVDITGCKVEKVNHSLPNGHTSVHLFSLTMPEQTYLAQSHKLNTLFNHPSVEGVYESQLPPSTRAVLELGNNCTFDESQRGVLGKGLEHGFDIAALRHCPAPRPYLKTSSLGYLFVYQVSAQNRQIFALFSSARQEAHIMVTNRGQDSQFPNVDRVYQEAYSERFGSNDNKSWQDLIEYSANQRIYISQFTTFRKAQAEINGILKRIRNEETGPTLLVLQTASDSIVADFPSLNDYPSVNLKLDSDDRDLPPLGWQTYVARRIIARYLDLGSWLTHLISLARYGNVPLGNLDYSDDPKYLIDIAFARRLQKENIVLWWSPGPRPDHGGYEKDDGLNQLEAVEMPSVITSGTYSTVCVDVQVKNLMINTILTSSLMNDADGSDSFSFNPAGEAGGTGHDGTLVLHAENTFTSAGIRVLRDMVRAWQGEAVSGNDMADVMVSHLVSWITSPTSFLYDRSLHYYVQVMARKILQQLLADCRRVGSHVVYASQNRLLLQTTKTEVGNAWSYCEYILRTIRAKPQFLFLDLEVREYWDVLVWYDEFNYGGRGCEKIQETEDSQEQLHTVMHWGIQDYLPTILRQPFHDYVVEFINLLSDRKRPGGPHSSRLTQLPLQNIQSEQSEQPEPTELLTKSGYAADLIQTVKSLLRRHRLEMQNPDLLVDWEYPNLPGSAPTQQKSRDDSPLLALVKFIVHVVSLDKSLALETRLVRKDLLALFEIREFSAQAQFSNPSASLKLRGVKCLECHYVRDLDLCRDEDFSISAESTNNIRIPGFRCVLCETQYNQLSLQERLLSDVVMRQVMEWSTQDLKCGKCSRLRNNDFMEHCACGGVWKETVSRTSVEEVLKVAGHVASVYGWSMVSQAVEDALREFV
ncbi:MAG: hypothetical protein Q9162_005779 [Coniocarpon cinnabarinum]